MPVQSASIFDSGHQDQIHDCQLDYYGRRLATASSDTTIKIFEVAGEARTHLADLTGHEGPVIVWKETAENVWQPIYTSPPTLLEASVNSVAWAPHELGLMLAAGASDGAIAVIALGASGNWETAKLEKAHALGCTAVSWAPPTPPGALVMPGAGAPLVKSFVSGGCDSTVKVWRFDESRGVWAAEAALAAHSDWVRDVAWAPNLGMPSNTIASAGQDGKVFIWTQTEPGGPWAAKLLADFKQTVWRVSWSVFGSVLAVSDASGSVTLWKEALDGEWAQVQRADGEAAA